MNSKIRVEYDFDKNEPFLQINLAKEQDGVGDSALKNFVEQASDSGVSVVFNSNVVQLRITRVDK